MSYNELFIVIIAAIILFGGKKMPEALRSWFKILRDLRRHYNLFKRQLELDLETIEHLERQKQNNANPSIPTEIDPTNKKADVYKAANPENESDGQSNKDDNSNLPINES